jgi:hypothetical protein
MTCDAEGFLENHCGFDIVVTLANLLEGPIVVLDEELGRSEGESQKEECYEEGVEGFHNKKEGGD